MSALAWVAALLLVGYVAGLLLLHVFQRSLLYHPRRRPVAPATVGFPEAETVVLATSDGERVIAWHVPPRPGHPLVIYFHGNAETVANRVDRHRALIATGAGLLAVSYRGYMGSTGKPSESGLLHDADAAYTFAASRNPAGISRCGGTRSAPASRWRSPRPGPSPSSFWKRRSHRPPMSPSGCSLWRRSGG
jgi:uncharacterized protein